LIGLGGLGSPAAMALASSPGFRWVLCDEDRVDVSNLHRQVLYGEQDVGRDKLDAARDALIGRGVSPERIELRRERCLPDNARELIGAVDLVLEGSDNFATKFLVADACHLERKPVVHGAAVRWVATAWLVRPGGRPCYRCLFEDVPFGQDAPDCAGAGVMGPVVGLAGAMMADLALDWLAGRDRSGALFSYDGKRDVLRRMPVHAREGCPLCGNSPTIREIREAAYVEPPCEAS